MTQNQIKKQEVLQKQKPAENNQQIPQKALDLGQLIVKDKTIKELLGGDQKAINHLKTAFFTAIFKDQEILKADRNSLFLTLQNCAKFELMPDGKEAVIVVKFIRNKTTNVTMPTAVLMPMVGGVIKMLSKIEDVSSLCTNVFCENDDFEHISGSSETIEHRPCYNNDRGEPLGVYAIVTFKDKSQQMEVVRWSDVIKAKEVALTKNVWNAWPEEMAKKTALHRLAKRLVRSETHEKVLDFIDFDLNQTTNFNNETGSDKQQVLSIICDKIANLTIESANEVFDFIKRQKDLLSESEIKSYLAIADRKIKQLSIEEKKND